MRQNKTAKPPARPDLAVDPKKSATKVEKPVAPGEKPTRRLYGLLTRKEKWVLSWRGRLVFWTAILILGLVFMLRVHPFLAVTERVDSPYLVVEGWVPNYALQDSIAEFRSKPYQMIFTVGADPLNGKNVEPGDSLAI